HPALGWVRMVIPLVSGSRRIGLWLLGRRDPDDFYATIEIPTLQALADQMAVAVLNHEQSEHLSRLYQVDIDRQEAERRQLALELHDGVLNQLGILSLTIEDDNPTFESAYQLATTHIRQIISGLRPTMLNYGLRTALDELADETPSHNHSDVKICVDMAETDIRYSPQVELHLYRIAQEACKNAIQHANAQVIRITGMLEPDSFDLTVADDGIGFARGQQLELNDLLANKHFGLAGMIERARLIGAQMEISSHPGRGTRVRVYGTCGHPC
ncbi:MAG TPA: ATP-binding protein, partial [Anaerolineaceae bacterium]